MAYCGIGIVGELAINAQFGFRGVNNDSWQIWRRLSFL